MPIVRPLSLTVASLAKEKVMEMLLSMDFALRVGVVELRSHCECWAPFSVLFTSMWSRKFGLFENNFAVGPCAFLYQAIASVSTFFLFRHPMCSHRSLYVWAHLCRHLYACGNLDEPDYLFLTLHACLPHLFRLLAFPSPSCLFFPWY